MTNNTVAIASTGGSALMSALRVVSLMAATISMGLVAGAFALYGHTIMPGLGRTGDRTFVAAFQEMDRAIVNPWFIGGCFMGALVFTVVAAITHFRTSAFGWIVAAFVLYAVAFVVTVAVNVPLNDALKAAGDPAVIDVAAAREAFDEARWNLANLIRIAVSTGAFGLLTWALVVTKR